MKKYYFSESDVDFECLKNRTFTINQLNEVYRDLFEKEIRENGDNETTFKSWFYDNLKMDLIREVESILIPKQYSNEYISCLPSNLESKIMEEMARMYYGLDIDEYVDFVENVQSKKLYNITEIAIHFI